MGRPKKPKIKGNLEEGFDDVLQWAINLTARNINEAQNSINLVDKSVEAEDVLELTKLIKERNDAIKIQQTSAKILVDLGKLLSSHMSGNKTPTANEIVGIAEKGDLSPEDKAFALKLAQDFAVKNKNE